MAKEVNWTFRARKDLIKTCRFIFKRTEDPIVAEEFSDKIFAQVDKLSLNEESGRLLPDVDDLPKPLQKPGLHIRELIIGNFRQINRIRSSDILVLRLIRCSRLLRNAYQPEPSTDQ